MTAWSALALKTKSGRRSTTASLTSSKVTEMGGWRFQQHLEPGVAVDDAMDDAGESAPRHGPEIDPTLPDP
jgi:hypothetical protein